ncbi:lasso RiPP family leader peptide-containing protein [Pseudonocardia sp. RS010]
MNNAFEQGMTDVYVAPALAEVGEFSEDTLGCFGGWADNFLWLC